MIRLFAALLLMTFTLAPLTAAQAEDLPIYTLPVEDLKSEADYHVQYVSEALSKLESDEDFEGIKKKVKRAGGTLAVVAQAIAHHPDSASANISAADLREAGKALRNAADATAARTALEYAIKSYGGEVSGNAAEDAEWKGLIGMHDMMEMISYRSSRLRRGVRRLRSPEEDKLHAVAIAVLSVAMEADTHEVKNDEEIPDWTKMSHESQEIAVNLVKAMSEKDEEKSQELYEALGKSCKTCHTQFRKEE